MISSFIKKTLVVVFGFVFSFSLVNAQVNWVPPSGAPLGNNVPAPVNVGVSNQTKQGGLTLSGNLISDTSSLFKGTSIFEQRQGGGGNNFIASFIDAGFYDNVYVGDGIFTYPDFQIKGRLQYKPINTNGTPLSLLSEEEMVNGGFDRVLVGNTDGDARWADSSALGGGTVVPTPGNVPNCSSEGQILRWNNTTQAWQCFGTRILALNPGSPNMKLQFGPTSTLELMDNSNFTFKPAQVTNSSTRYVLTNDGSGGNTVQWTDESLLGGGGIPGIANNGDTLVYNASTQEWEATNWITHTDSYPNNNVIKLSATSASVDPNNNYIQLTAENRVDITATGGSQGYGPDASTINLNADRNIGFNSFANTFTNNQFRIYHPNDVNPQLAYVFDRFNFDTEVNVAKDLTVQTAGDLYLEGVDPTPYAQADDQEHLCVIPNGKVTTCVNAADSGGPIDDTGVLGGGGSPNSVLYGPQHNGLNFTFTSNATATIDVCAGGGGGGGGGHGQINYGQYGSGGGGGGGGDMGNCQTLSNQNFNSGDVLTWNIGSGGSGGHGGHLLYNGGNIQSIYGAAAGGYGSDTYLYKNGQQISHQTGTAGGNPGSSYNPNNNQTPGGGQGGDALLPNWHDGASGSTSAYTSCSSCGGPGGHGDSPSGNNVTPSTGSVGGIGGLSTAYSAVGNDYIGKNGISGLLAAGGGGGGGATGAMRVVVPGAMYELRGGNGGNGGNGYVRITSSAVNITPGQAVFSTPGTNFTHNLEVPPGTQNVFVQVWGAGGAGGSAYYNGSTQPTPSINGGGGGSGAYRTLSFAPPACATDGNPNNCTIQIEVGAGGQPGDSGPSQGVVTTSTNGGQSKVVFTINNITPVSGVIANGGAAGTSNSYTGSPAAWNGAGGAGGAAPNDANNSTTEQAGVAGQAGSAGGAGGGSGTSGLGGDGVKITDSQLQAPNIIPAENGQDGKVIISWQ